MMKNRNVLSIEGSQNADKNMRVNYIYLRDDCDGWYEINGKLYTKVIKKENGEWRNFEEQKKLLEEKVKDYKSSSVYPFIQIFDEENISEIYNSKEILRKFIDEMSKKAIILSALELLGVQEYELNNIGMIGSYQVGQFSRTSDIDLIFFFEQERSYQIFENIQHVISTGNALYGIGERSRINPLRFKHQNEEFCIHFSLPNDLIDKFYISEDEKGVPTVETYEIRSIEYSIYCPTILETTTDEYLILYNGADRGIFDVGERIEVVGKKYNSGVVIEKYERNLG